MNTCSYGSMKARVPGTLIQILCSPEKLEAWKDGSVGKALAIQAWGPEYKPQYLGGGHCPPIMPVVERQRQRDPEAHWPASLTKWARSRFNEGTCLKNKGKSNRIQLRLTSGPPHIIDSLSLFTYDLEI